MRLAKLSSASGTDQLPVTPLAPHPYTQRLGGFINFVPVDSVARPSQYFCEFVVAHSAESSRTAPSTENPSFICPLQFPAKSQKKKLPSPPQEIFFNSRLASTSSSM